MRKIDIRLKASKQFIFLMLFIVLGSLGALWSACLPLFLKGLLSFFVMMYGWPMLQRHAFLRGEKAIIGLQSLNDQDWLIFQGDKEIVAQIAGKSTMTTLGSILQFISSDQRVKQHCVIWNDSLSPDAYRQLRVWLFCHKSSCK